MSKPTLKPKVFRVLLSGPEVRWEHRETPEHWEQHEDGSFVREYTRHEHELRDTHKDHPDRDQVVARELARLQELDAGDRIPRVVIKRAEADVTVAADTPDTAAALALAANPSCDTVESIEAL